MEGLQAEYDKTPLGSVKFFQLMKKKYPGIRRTDVYEFVRGQKSRREAQLPPPGRRIYAKYTTPPGHTQQCDLLSIQGEFSAGGFHYLLTCIDIGSRLAGAYPLKSKKPPEVAAALEHLQKHGYGGVSPLGKPRRIECDRGGEFMGAFARYCDAEGIELMYGEPENKRDSSIVERYNGTLGNAITRALGIYGRGKWLGALTSIIQAINDTRDMKRVKKVVKGPKIAPSLHVLNPVRVLLPYSKTRKARMDNWSKQIYLISAVKRQKATNAILYTVLDPSDGIQLNKKFYRWELQPWMNIRQIALR